MKQEELQAIAAQLKHPTGEKGIEMANMMHETNINMTHHSIQNLNVSKENKILELGHGNAGHLEFLMDQAESLVYYGLEMSELMFQEARQINRNYVSQKQAFFLLYDGGVIPATDAFFDKIFTVNTIYFWQKPEELLLEIYRVLKPNGTFCLTFAEESFMKQLPFTEYEFTLYSTEKAQELIEKTAFKMVYKETLTEKIKSKTGELVDRAFTTIVLEK
ncbi:class I SAM-dependent methyltransferase [Flavobacterium sp. FlaQc-52]|jgi:ubiquinone/menaquinone biosynthesis C-methylase UbiE|uniref:Class I SAM-dependent methyltransferase n=1 Tax=Flavobacterium cupriresistens TaxID=2893885 RepID=A0ABU4RHA5_9FLAO|nr:MULTISPECIES: class I SAM-dependent methyltransferase [unclassified Flavobacterium]MDX6190785.1 class I SAM-dependent methyltransferase [Flavobacterium sp. Fl-318]UFH44041.1 class I SAM-dependent methyltransferase [Flavobacterium sp. F-323]